MTIEESIKALEKHLTASEEGDDEKKAIRSAIVKQAIGEMDEDEKRAIREALMEAPTETYHGEKGKKGKTANTKKAGEEGPEGEVDQKGGKTAKGDGDGDDDGGAGKGGKAASQHATAKIEYERLLRERDAQIASLTASVNYMQAKPLIDEMLTARRNAGATEAQLKSFSENLYGKNITEIQQRYDEDKSLLTARVSASPMPFNGAVGGFASGGDKTMEAMF